MKWKKFIIETIPEAEDIIISTLYDIGLEGAQIEDKIPLTKQEKEQMFVDILPEPAENDGTAYISFYLEPEADQEAVLEKVRAGLAEIQSWGTDVGAGVITASETEDKDWINNWKQYFKPFTVDDILIKPTWETVPREHQDKLLIQIDPGTAFGTGMHETTQLCIRQIRKYVTDQTVLLDVGTGSGILSIVALKLGAVRAVGTDLDPCAISASKENMEVNGIAEEQFTVIEGNLIDDRKIQELVGYGTCDMVVANILAEVLVPLTPAAAAHLKKGGIYITSGIIDNKEETVVEAVKRAGLTVLEVTRQGEWVSVTARKDQE